MMDCAHYRRAIGADPRQTNEDMAVHAAGCHDCTRYTEQLRAFERHIVAALDIDVTKVAAVPGARDALVHPAWPRRSRTLPAGLRPRGLAIAASVLLATTAAGGLWLASPGRSLAADVVNHMAGEPNAWERTRTAVAPRRVDEVLSGSRLQLKANVGLVSYANSCMFRGHLVPHLVVQTASGPVTVMVLTEEIVRWRMHFDEQGYRGMIVAVPHRGSIAVLEQSATSDSAALDRVAAQVVGAIDWATSRPAA